MNEKNSEIIINRPEDDEMSVINNVVEYYYRTRLSRKQKKESVEQ